MFPFLYLLRKVGGPFARFARYLRLELNSQRTGEDGKGRRGWGLREEAGGGRGGDASLPQTWAHTNQDLHSRFERSVRQITLNY